MPFNSHFKKLEVLRLQLDCPRPVQKRIWQAIIRAKIQNQAACLSSLGKSGCGELRELSDKVQSGDTGNVEAIAARKYFIHLFGSGFSREHDNFENAALNYTYALVRGAIARTLVVCGFEPSLGVCHCNNLNAYNLADDLIEPFRPICDLLVASLEKKPRLDKDSKQSIINIFKTSCSVDGETLSVVYAIEKLVASLKTSMEGKNINLKLPVLLAAGTKRYE
jgi:CRISPR-associated protein Cas1